VKPLSANVPLTKNPSYDGWIMEADFMVQLRLAKDGHPFSLVDFQNPGSRNTLWQAAKRAHFTKVEEVEGMTGLGDFTWLLPTAWNQGGYDAVQLLPGNGVRFVQVTRANSHSLKLKYVVLLLEALQKAAYNAASFEIAFVIPSTADPLIFKIPNVVGTLGRNFKDKLKKTGSGLESFLYGLHRNK